MSEPARDDHPIYCLGCEYRLDHLTERRCPECGREFDPQDPATFGNRFTSLPSREHLPPMCGVAGLFLGGVTGIVMGSIALAALLAFLGLIFGFVAGYGLRGNRRQ